MKNSLTPAREFCFQYIFHFLGEEAQAQKMNSVELVASINEYIETFDKSFGSEQMNFIMALIKGIMANRSQVDEKLKKNLKNWKIERLAKVDRSILTLAIYEIDFYMKTPPKVVINEAIELAKKYGPSESKKFINAVLDKIVKEKV